MSIQRQYSLPNCTLMIEGMSDDTIPSDHQRPLLSIVVNAECRFQGIATTLNGGRAFLESLIHSVSAYTQEFLSGIYHPQENQGYGVHFERLETNHLHRLIWQPEAEQNGNKLNPITLDLTTAQLFDLLEAVDQCVADSNTLPDIAVEIAPLSRRYRTSEAPTAEKFAPAALGISGLLLVASALFFLPVPEVREVDPRPVETNGEEVLPVDPQGVEPEPLEKPIPTQNNEDDLGANPLPGEGIEASLAAATEISDPTQVRYLQRDLYRTLDQAWKNRSGVNQTLQYKVLVTQGGLIVNYEPSGTTAQGQVQATPLPELTYISAESGTTQTNAIAPYRVVFTRRGVLQVSPWNGFQEEPTLGKKITDTDQVQQLQGELRQILAEKWQGLANSNRELVYRVALNREGAIADYEADNQAAVDYAEETPFPQLLQPQTAKTGTGENATVIPQEALAHYQVILKPTGKFEISLWED